MDPQREGGAQNAQQYVLPETLMVALPPLRLNYRRSTGKKANVSFNKMEAYIWNTGRGNGATGVHQSIL